MVLSLPPRPAYPALGARSDRIGMSAIHWSYPICSQSITRQETRRRPGGDVDSAEPGGSGAVNERSGSAMLDYLPAEIQVQNGQRMVRFGDFEVDLHSGELRQSGILVKLQEQPFKVLQILLEHHGDLVTREELQSRIWPERSFGDFDHAVNVAIGKLRAALGDSADTPSFVQTIPRRGYRFVAEVHWGPAIALAPAVSPTPQAVDVQRTAGGSLLRLALV